MIHFASYIYIYIWVLVPSVDSQQIQNIYLFKPWCSLFSEDTRWPGVGGGDVVKIQEFPEKHCFGTSAKTAVGREPLHLSLNFKVF